MLSWLLRWINERWPLFTLANLALSEDIPGGSSFSYTFGSTVITVFLLQAVTGILQLFFYVPTVEHAYDSLSFLWFQVPFGWLIHGLHYWGANAMIVLVVFHLSRVFIWGAYKRPRELTWLIGISLLLVVMGLSFTGGPLPWNQKGYWAAEVGTSIPGSIPIVGDLIKRVMRGGEKLGQLTLSRLFIVHAAILPSTLLALIGLHLISFRKFGTVGPWNAAKREKAGPFWPDQIFKDLVMSTFIILFLIGLSVFVPPPIYGPADPLDNTYIPKPEWNFLFLYQTLKYFQGWLEPVGVMGVPGLLFLILALLPFYDRQPERNPFRRPVAMFGALVLIGILISFSLIGYYSKPSMSEVTAPPPVIPSVSVSSSVQKDSQLIKSLGCLGCHTINGIGGKIGPDLSQEGSRGRTRDWLTTQIQNPKAHDPNTVMPAFSSLNNQQLNELVDYLQSLGAKTGGTMPKVKSGLKKPPKMKSSSSQRTIETESRLTNTTAKKDPGSAAYIIGSSERGAELFTKECSLCHGSMGTDKVSNPGSEEGTVPPLNPIDKELFSNDPQEFAENIDRFIQHGSIPAGSNPQLKMIAFGDTNALTQQQIANIEAYILRLNGVERSKLINPGMKPRVFFLLVVGVYVLLILAQGGIRMKRGIP